MLSQENIIELGELLGYALKNRFSHGFSILLAATSVQGQSSIVFECLKEIENKKGAFDELKKALEESKAQRNSPNAIFQRELPALLVFYAVIEAYLSAEPTIDVLKKYQIPAGSIELLVAFLEPLKAGKASTFCLLDKNCIFDGTQLRSYLNDLAQELANKERPLPLVLHNINHSVVLMPKSTSSWSYVDCASFSSPFSYMKELSHEDLVSTLFEAFKTDKYIIFNSKIFAAEREPQLMQDLVALDLKYPMLASEQGLLFDSHRASLLHFACQSGQLKLVEELLSQKFTLINLATTDGFTPLYLAVKYNQEAVVETLLTQDRIDINTSDMKGKTPFFLACEQGGIKIVRALLKRKDLLINREPMVSSSLLAAMEQQHVEVVFELLKQETLNVNYFDQHEGTPLFRACEMKSKEIIQGLLKHPLICPNLTNLHSKKFQTPLGMLCEKGEVDLVKELLQHEQIDVNLIGEDFETPLYLASKNGHLACVQALLKRDEINLNYSKPNGETALSIACKNNHSQVVRALSEHENTEINLAGYQGETALSIACQNSAVELVQILLKHKKINVNCLTYKRESPLFLACQNEQQETLKLLLQQKNIDLNIANEDGKTALYLACESGKLNLVKILLKEKNIIVNQADNFGDTPLNVACSRAYLNIVDELLQNEKINVNQGTLKGRTSKACGGVTPLHRACSAGNVDLVKKLLKHKSIQVNLRFHNGNGTALHIACLRGHSAVVEELLKFEGIELYSVLADGLSAFHQACKKGHAEVVSAFLKKESFDWRHRTTNQETGLHLACRRGALNVVQILLTQKHVDVNAQDYEGRTPLHIVCENKELAILEELLKKEDLAVNIRTKRTGVSPLFKAVTCGFVEGVRCLLAHKNIDENIKNFYGSTPLYAACKHHYLEIVKILLKSPRIFLSLNYTSNYNFPPLVIASQNGGIDIVRELLKHDESDVNIKTLQGSTAFDFALITKNLDIISELLKHNNLNPGVLSKIFFDQACRDKSKVALAMLMEAPFFKNLARNALDPHRDFLKTSFPHVFSMEEEKKPEEEGKVSLNPTLRYVAPFFQPGHSLKPSSQLLCFNPPLEQDGKRAEPDGGEKNLDLDPKDYSGTQKKRKIG